MYVSVNNQLISFQISSESYLAFAAKGLKNLFPFRMSPQATKHSVAGSICPRGRHLRGLI